uniref:type I polyketide synthase n=1 Tax=Bradyrhizobium sp. SZCCHNS1012 TaxID=3057297 RepID=UPI002916390E
LEEYWSNLRQGVDSIREIPPERWDHKAYFDAEKGKAGKSYSKWGGFINGVEEFDPLFFNISPREAEVMDPQGRLFLETVWTLLEGSGYTKEELQHRHQGRIGVYVGAGGASIAAIANRVSYFFDFEGPSVAVDTLCSSSAMAIHLACQALLQGECALAIAGGVNLSIHPAKYVALSQLQMLGSHAESRSFGDGDGYLPAEGVGAVLLKPLPQAAADGDDILAVIKGTATRHSGRATGYAVPNPTLQAKVAEESLRRAGIEAGTVSYVEAAANGSGLGDPIEVAALNRVFGKSGGGQTFCALGSVKSSIGHPEAASGIAQLTKVVLQLRHRQLAPTIKTEPLNPNLQLEGTSFALQRELGEWRRPVLAVDGQSQEVPRRALINSYGAGGAYVSLVVEEYTAAVSARAERPMKADRPQICVFSARSGERLQAVAEQMRRHVEQEEQLDLGDLAYTLQLGREAMEVRLALVVRSRSELLDGLGAYLAAVREGKEVPAALSLYMGDTDQGSPQFRQLHSGRPGESFVQSLMAEGDLERLALYWTQGGKVPWARLHEGSEARKIALPTYPFARERY